MEYSIKALDSLCSFALDFICSCFSIRQPIACIVVMGGVRPAPYSKPQPRKFPSQVVPMGSCILLDMWSSVWLLALFRSRERTGFFDARNRVWFCVDRRAVSGYCVSFFAVSSGCGFLRPGVVFSDLLCESSLLFLRLFGGSDRLWLRRVVVLFPPSAPGLLGHGCTISLLAAPYGSRSRESIVPGSGCVFRCIQPAVHHGLLLCIAILGRSEILVERVNG